MDDDEAKATLHRYLRLGSDALLWKLDGLGEYDARRPLTPTGTNLLGLLTHLAWVEAGYFGETFGRPFAEAAPTYVDDVLEDMWVPAQVSRAEVLALHARATAHADATIAALPLDAVGRVPWWRPESAEVSLHRVLVHVATENHRHAGHADLVRELVDGATGLRPGATNIPDEVTDWPAHVARVERAAREAAALSDDAAG